MNLTPLDLIHLKSNFELSFLQGNLKWRISCLTSFHISNCDYACYKDGNCLQKVIGLNYMLPSYKNKGPGKLAKKIEKSYLKNF